MPSNNVQKKDLSQDLLVSLLQVLKDRFEKNTNRHKGLVWDKIKAVLESKPEKLWSLNEMEKTGGEPDMVGFDEASGQYLFYDCSEQTPKSRVNFCYDNDALESRKKFKPKNSALSFAESIGVELLTTEEYEQLQTLGEFDTKTSSWLKTPESIRKLGGALFGDRRFDTVFVYHNGADSYYGVRGFRGVLGV